MPLFSEDAQTSSQKKAVFDCVLPFKKKDCKFHNWHLIILNTSLMTILNIKLKIGLIRIKFFLHGANKEETESGAFLQ